MRRLASIERGIVAAALCASTAACSACSESDGGGGTPSDAGVQDATPDRDASLESGSPDADAAGDAPSEAMPDAPAGVPPGWEPWTGWSDACPLWVPGEHGEMPPPIEWEPCEEPIPQNIDCRQMKQVWKDGGTGIGFFPRMSVGASGSALLAFSRVYYHGDPDTRYRLVAEADGPVRVAFLQKNPANKGCVVNEEALNEDSYLFRVLGDTWEGDLKAEGVVEGLIAGPIDEPLPTTVLKQPAEPSLHSNWSVSKDWIIQRKGDRTAWSWDLKTQHTVYTASEDPDKLRGFLPTVIGKDVLLEVGDGLPRGVMTWNLDQGLRPLIRWYGDASKGAGNFATDGKDMVWTYVEGPLGNDTYEKLDVMTSPFTTDAAQVQAKRLRSDVKGFDPDPWVVGCGYAARGAVVPAPNHNSLFIVRLSDGNSWLLPGKLDLPKRQWDIPLGLTCDEVFTTVGAGGVTRIVRIRLDSLGPGTPPD